MYALINLIEADLIYSKVKMIYYLALLFYQLIDDCMFVYLKKWMMKDLTWGLVSYKIDK